MAGPDNLLTQRFHDSIFHISSSCKYSRNKGSTREIQKWFWFAVFLSVLLPPPPSTPLPLPLLSSTHPTPKYGAITNSFTEAAEFLVIVSSVFKRSTHWWKHVIGCIEETSGAFQAFMDKKSRLVVFSSKMYLNWIKEAKEFKLSRQSKCLL